MNGFSELDTLSLNYLENDILKLNEKFIPLATASTRSADNEGGAPKKSDTEISDSGEETRDKEKNNN